MLEHPEKQMEHANSVAKQIKIISYTKLVDGSGTSPLGALDLLVDKYVEPGSGY
jgi:hypothetical protein